MSEAAAKNILAEQFDGIDQQHEAAKFGMWVFLATEVLFFGGLFLCYTVYRYLYPEAFAAASRHTEVILGGANTAILLFSSTLMALAVRAAQLGRRKHLVWLLLATALIVVGLEGIAYASSLMLLRLAIIFIGFGGGIVNGGTNALVADISSEGKGASLNLLGVFFGIGAVGVPFVLATMSGRFSNASTAMSRRESSGSFKSNHSRRRASGRCIARSFSMARKWP